MTRTRVRIVNENGNGYMTRVWLNDVEVTASVRRLVVDVNDVVELTLSLPAVAVDYQGEAEVAFVDDAPEPGPDEPVTRKWLSEVFGAGLIACLCRHGRGGNRENANPECPRHGWEARERAGERPRVDW